MRAGEAISLNWADIDVERRLINLKRPEKGSNPRIFKVSAKLIDMTSKLPKKIKKGLRRSLPRFLKSITRCIKKKSCMETCKPKTTGNSLSHLAALESNHGIPQNQRPLSCQRAPWTQKSKKHRDLHQPRASNFQ